MLPTPVDLQAARTFEAVQQFQLVGQRVSELKSKIDHQKSVRKEIESSNESRPGDWTHSYKKWSKWEDIDDLERRKKQEEERMQSLLDKQDVMQHQHDHSKEKEFFDLPEEEKMKRCEQNGVVGNYLFQEGCYARALERFQIAIAFYEYCFPADEAQQRKLDSFRHVCLCNAALCCIRLGWYRKAIENADLVLRDGEDEHRGKALFRRGQAYRFLDEYDKSIADLEAALVLRPGDEAILEELRTVKQLEKSYEKKSTKLARSMMEKNNSAKAEIQQPAGSSDEQTLSIYDNRIPLEPIFPNALNALHDIIDK